MRKITKIILAVVMGLGAVGGAVAYALWESEDPILLGPISVAELQVPPYEVWYSQQSTDYEVDLEAVAGLQDLMKDAEVTIVMGTWCHDSQRQVPRFYKILAAAGLSPDRVHMLAVDEDFTTPEEETEGLGITNTPTFIFRRQGQEINRIVEVPVESLEQDMMVILKNQPYRHSKMPPEED